jgi:hypothetical protein
MVQDSGMRLCDQASGFRVRRSLCGRGQRMSLTLPFGEIPWFDVPGEIQRCDWLKRNPRPGHS